MVDRLPRVARVSITYPLDEVVWLVPNHLIIKNLLHFVLLYGRVSSDIAFIYERGAAYFILPVPHKIYGSCIVGACLRLHCAIRDTAVWTDIVMALCEQRFLPSCNSAHLWIIHVVVDLQSKRVEIKHRQHYLRKCRFYTTPEIKIWKTKSDGMACTCFRSKSQTDSLYSIIRSQLRYQFKAMHRKLQH